MPSQWTAVLVDGDQMWAYLSLPDGPGPYPGIVAAPTGLGVDDWIREVADKLASEGYATIVPDLYHRDDPNITYFRDRLVRLRDDNIIRDVQSALEHLRIHPMVLGDSTGILGFCLGGRVVYLCAGSIPLFQTAACFYGRDITVPWGDGPSPFERTAKINCPFIGFWADDDPNPTPEDVKKFEAELKRHEKVYEFHSYAGAGHTYMSDRTDEYRPEAATDSWEKLFAWFRKHLDNS